MKKKRLTKKAMRELRKWILERLVMARDLPGVTVGDEVESDVASGEFLVRMRQMRDLIAEHRKVQDDFSRLKFRIRGITALINVSGKRIIQEANNCDWLVDQVK